MGKGNTLPADPRRPQNGISFEQAVNNPPQNLNQRGFFGIMKGKWSGAAAPPIGKTNE